MSTGVSLNRAAVDGVGNVILTLMHAAKVCSY